MMPLISYKQRMATLWQRPSNKVYYATWEDNGKTRRKSLHTTDKRIALPRFNHFQRELIAGKVRNIDEGSKKSFYDFADEFLKHVEGSSTSAATYILYDVALKKAKESIGNIPLKHINAKHIDKCITDMRRENLKSPTINKNLRHIKAAFKKAYAWQYLSSPIRDFPKMLKEEKRLRFLTIDQVRALVGAISTDQEFADFCLFSAYTGLRSGELIRLTWYDVDHPEGFLRVSPKQKNKMETSIPINKMARAILDRIGLGLSKKETTGKVFRFGTLTWVSQKCKAAYRKAGIPDARFHDLRHTFASHLAMSGENLKTIQELMRHESIQSTMVYAKVSPEHLREASDRLNYGPMPMVQAAGQTAQKPTKTRPPKHK